MEKFVGGDVVILNFPFTNLSNKKRRPALIIKVPKGEDLIVCQITGKSYDSSVEVVLKKEDFQEGNLKLESYLRIDKMLSIEKYLINYKAGSLKKEKFNEILDKICNFLKE